MRVRLRFGAPALAALAVSACTGTAPVTRLSPCPSTPNCVSSKAPDETHRVEPFPFSGSAAESLARVKAAALALPRARVVVDESGYVRLTFRSAVFGFVDDVELEADEAAKVIHVRSASRVGRSDFGVNRKRVEAIRSKLGR